MGLKNYSTNPRTRRIRDRCLMAPRKNTTARIGTRPGTRWAAAVPSARAASTAMRHRDAGTLQASLGVPLYRDTTKFTGGRHLFNGTLRELPPEHREWTFPLRWKGAAQPLLGPGMPSLIFVGDMAEIFLPGRSPAVIDRTLGTLASSHHIGLVLTKLPERMVAYITAQHPAIPAALAAEALAGLQRGRPSLFR